MRCMECNEMGHLKCTTEDKSSRIKLDFTVSDNLDEFTVSNRKKGKKFRKMIDSNIVVPSSDSDEGSESDEQDFAMGCAGCGSNGHDVTGCNRRGNQRYNQYENVRAKFAKDVGFNFRKTNSSYGNRDNQISYSKRVQEDPRAHRERDRREEERRHRERWQGDSFRSRSRDEAHQYREQRSRQEERTRHVVIDSSNDPRRKKS